MGVHEPEADRLRNLTALDKTIHEPGRLAIVSYLAVVAEADFLFLLDQTGLTRGNLSSHMGKLEAAGYIEVDKTFVERWVHGYDEFMERAGQYSLADAAEICGVALEQIEEMADLYAGADRLALSIGNGIERGRSGGSGLRAIMSLSVILGKLGRKGSGVIAKPGFAVPSTGDKLQRTDLVPDGTRTVNIVDVGRLLLDVYGHLDFDHCLTSITA